MERPEPFMEIEAEPQSKFRFRYKSEMTGKHGSLLGVGLVDPQQSQVDGVSSTAVQSKLFPTVKLHNFSGEAEIRVSLVCDTRPHYPHPHLLEMGQGGESESESVKPFVELPVSPQNDYTAVFQGLNIIYVSKKESRRVLEEKMSTIENDGGGRWVGSDQLDDLALTINLNVVCLYFEAINRQGQQICEPQVSSPIHHNKSALTGELRIVRIDKFSSCCTGNEEVFILVEKVDKQNIQVKFYEETDKGLEIWKSYGEFGKLDVHHQYAIVFRTPPYRSFTIDAPIDVWIQLERSSDGATSPPIPFQYTPINPIRKMPKRQPRNRNEESEDNSESGFEPQAGFQQSGSGTGSESAGNSGNYPLAGPSNIRQGTTMASDASQSKSLAMSVALSICQGIHGWAETSDFTALLQKLRHLLCLVNENGDNALHSAIINQQKEPFLRILETLSAFPDTVGVVNEKNTQSLTPLHLAVLAKRHDFVVELLEHNADISIQNVDGDTPLHFAMRENDIACVKLLLQSSTASAAINKFNYASMSPLLIAVTNGCTELVQILCGNKANLRMQEGTHGKTPLHVAVEKETKESIINTLIILKSAQDSATDLTNIQNYRGDTPLHVSANSGFTTLSALLMHYGADPGIENHVRVSETEEDEEEEGGNHPPPPSTPEQEDRLNGHTVFDVVTNDKVLRVLKGTEEDWEIILKACSPLLISSPSLLVPSSSHDKDPNFDSKILDSGIDDNFNSSQFLSSSSNQLS